MVKIEQVKLNEINSSVRITLFWKPKLPALLNGTERNLAIEFSACNRSYILITSVDVKSKP